MLCGRCYNLDKMTELENKNVISDGKFVIPVSCHFLLCRFAGVTINRTGQHRTAVGKMRPVRLARLLVKCGPRTCGPMKG